MSSQANKVAGIAGGTLLGVSYFPPWADVLQTTVLAIVGAAVSFTVSLLLQRLMRRRR